MSDFGYRDYKGLFSSLTQRTQASDTFFRYEGFIFAKNREYYHNLMKEAHEEIINFYKRKHNTDNVFTEGKINIAGSMDGTYTKRSFLNIYNSRYCITFMFHCPSGTPIDYVASEICHSENCSDKNKQDSTTTCPENKLHGTSRSMEVANAIKLFTRSTASEFPFRYTKFVGDGDADVANRIISENFYGDIPVSKEECMRHFFKNIRKHLMDLFENTTHKVAKVAFEHIPADKLEDNQMKIDHPFKRNSKQLTNKFAGLIHNTMRENKDESSQVMSDLVNNIPCHYMDNVHATLQQ